MEESIANDVVDKLRERRILASVNRRVGVYSVGLRVVLPDGREAIWDNDGSPGLEAMVLRDGVLVGFVPLIPGTEGLDAEAITEIIAKTDYDAPPPQQPSNPTRSPGAQRQPMNVAPATKKWADRLRRR